jgi:hypothetical protein
VKLELVGRIDVGDDELVREASSDSALYQIMDLLKDRLRLRAFLGDCSFKSALEFEHALVNGRVVWGGGLHAAAPRFERHIK